MHAICRCSGQPSFSERGQNDWIPARSQLNTSSLNLTGIPVITFFSILKGPCISVTCSWSSWGSWSSTCGRMTRQRVSNAKQSIIHLPNCIGLQTSCPLPEAQSIYISCTSYWLCYDISALISHQYCYSLPVIVVNLFHEMPGNRCMLMLINIMQRSSRFSLISNHEFVTLGLAFTCRLPFGLE